MEEEEEEDAELARVVDTALRRGRLTAPAAEVYARGVEARPAAVRRLLERLQRKHGVGAAAAAEAAATARGSPSAEAPAEHGKRKRRLSGWAALQARLEWLPPFSRRHARAAPPPPPPPAPAAEAATADPAALADRQLVVLVALLHRALPALGSDAVAPWNGVCVRALALAHLELRRALAAYLGELMAAGAAAADELFAALLDGAVEPRDAAPALEALRDRAPARLFDALTALLRRVDDPAAPRLAVDLLLHVELPRRRAGLVTASPLWGTLLWYVRHAADAAHFFAGVIAVLLVLPPPESRSAARGAGTPPPRQPQLFDIFARCLEEWEAEAGRAADTAPAAAAPAAASPPAAAPESRVEHPSAKRLGVPPPETGRRRSGPPDTLEAAVRGAAARPSSRASVSSSASAASSSLSARSSPTLAASPDAARTRSAAASPDPAPDDDVGPAGAREPAAEPAAQERRRVASRQTRASSSPPLPPASLAGGAPKPAASGLVPCERITRMLFRRLYALYPWDFVSYLRSAEVSAPFAGRISALLLGLPFHPALVSPLLVRATPAALSPYDSAAWDEWMAVVSSSSSSSTAPAAWAAEAAAAEPGGPDDGSPPPTHVRGMRPSARPLDASSLPGDARALQSEVLVLRGELLLERSRRKQMSARVGAVTRQLRASAKSSEQRAVARLHRRYGHDKERADEAMAAHRQREAAVEQRLARVLGEMDALAEERDAALHQFNQMRMREEDRLAEAESVRWRRGRDEHDALRSLGERLEAAEREARAHAARLAEAALEHEALRRENARTAAEAASLREAASAAARERGGASGLRDEAARLRGLLEQSERERADLARRVSEQEHTIEQLRGWLDTV